MIEVGSVRIKNTKSILIKNLLDCCFGSVVFFAYGWALAFGESNAFIGRGFREQRFYTAWPKLKGGYVGHLFIKKFNLV